MEHEHVHDLNDRLEFLKEKVLPFEVAGVLRNCPQANEILDDSTRSSAHFVGASAIDRIMQYLEWQREDGHRSITNEKMAQRLERFLAIGETILATFPEISAVAFFGSSLRGKPVPRDHDIMIFPAFDAEVSKEAIEPALIHGKIALEFDRARISLYVLEHEESPEILKSGPYLFMARGPETKAGFPGLCRIYFNDSGDEWQLPR